MTLPNFVEQHCMYIGTYVLCTTKQKQKWCKFSFQRRLFKGSKNLTSGNKQKNSEKFWRQHHFSQAVIDIYPYVYI
jgi:hypothetical protein